MNDLIRSIWKRHVALRFLRRFHPQVDVRVAEWLLRVDVRDAIIGRLLYLDGGYEGETERLIRAIDLEGGVSVDIGANIGLHTVLMSALTGPAGKVFAFEPEAGNFRLLKHNLNRNGSSNVTAIQAAVGGRNGACRLALNPDNFGDHRVAHGSPTGRAEVEVPLTTIDESLRSLPHGVVKLIKIDVQGYEWHVIQGMAETLRSNPDAILIVEIFPEGLAEAGSSASQLVGRLRDLGFDGWEFNDFRLIPMQEPWTYDLIRGGKYVDVALSRSGKRLNQALSKLYGPLPPRGATTSQTAVPA